MPPQAADQHGATLETLCADLAATRHVIVASNQGPVSFTDRGNNALSAGSGSIGNLAVLQGKLPLTCLVAVRGGQCGWEPEARFALSGSWSGQRVVTAIRLEVILPPCEGGS